VRIRIRVCVAALGPVLLAAGCNQPQIAEPTAQPAVKGSGTVTGLRMIDASVGWAYGGLRLEHTTNGGQSFTDVTPPGVNGATSTVDARRVIRSHDFVDGSRALVLIGTVSSRATEDLERTTDAGATWTKVTTIEPEGGAAAIDFIDALHGWLIEDSWITGCGSCAPQGRHMSLLRTTDGGVTWARTYQSTQHFANASLVQVTTYPAPSLQPITDCGWWGPTPQFLSPQIGFAGLSCPGSIAPSFAETIEGGNTWRDVSLPGPLGSEGPAVVDNVDRVHFFSRQDGIAFVTRCVGAGSSCTPSGAMLRTQDGGGHWTVGATVQGSGLELDVADANHAWLPDASFGASTETSLLVTDTAGTSWSSVALPASLDFPRTGGSRQLQLVTPLLGFGMIWTLLAPDPQFFRTTDGGRTFEPFVPTFA
jgi:hypothetical protein